MMFFEDIAVGEVRELGSHLFTAEDIKRFAEAFDPQPFHLDEAAAKRSHFGRLCASGWHTTAVWMQLNVRDLQRRSAALADAGAPVAKFGPSPGFEDLKWLKPVYAGDTISFDSEVVAKRESRSRPGWGIVTTRNKGRNGSGAVVMSFVGVVLVERREKAAAAP